jgi:hypothetical protein
MIVNQYSFVFGSLFVVALVAFFGLREGVSLRGLLALGVTVLVVLGVWLLVRTGSSTYAQVAQVEAILAGGQPTLVEFYSNY